MTPIAIRAEVDDPDAFRINRQAVNKILAGALRIRQDQPRLRYNSAFAANMQPVLTGGFGLVPKRSTDRLRPPRPMDVMNPVEVRPGAIAAIDQYPRARMASGNFFSYLPSDLIQMP